MQKPASVEEAEEECEGKEREKKFDVVIERVCIMSQRRKKNKGNDNVPSRLTKMYDVVRKFLEANRERGEEGERPVSLTNIEPDKNATEAPL